MPILRTGPYKFFYANENDEPAHIHVQQGSAVAKFWLEPVAYAKSTGFSARELSKLLKLIEEHQSSFREAWNDFFNN